MITIRTGSAVDNYDKIAHLIRENWEESGSGGLGLALEINVATFRQVEKNRNLFTLLALDGDEIIGYSINFITLDPHASGDTRAMNSAIFVTKSKRCTAAGLKLICETEREAMRLGASVMTWESQSEAGLAKILEQMQYTDKRVTYSKRL